MASLSKPTYLMGLHCPKLLWHGYNAKEELPAGDFLRRRLAGLKGQRHLRSRQH